MSTNAACFGHILVASLGVLPLSAGCQTPPHTRAKEQAEQRWSQVRGQVKLQLARQQFERGQFEDVLKTLQEVTALDPFATDAYALLAKTNLELGKPATAEQVIRAARAAELDNADLHYYQGVVLEERNDLEAAIEEYRVARTLDATNVDYLSAQVECLVAVGRSEEALSLVDTHSGQFDDESTLAVLGARISALAGDSADALVRFRNPAVDQVSSRLVTEETGRLLAEGGQCDEAVRILEPLCRDAQPDGSSVSGSVRRDLARCYLNQQQPEAAKAVLSGYSEAHPEDTAAQRLLAEAALKVGDYLTALRAAGEAYSQMPESAELGLILATVHWKRGNPATAEAVLNKVLGQTPTDVDGWCLLGEVLLASNRPEDADAAFGRAREIDSESPWVGMYLSEKTAVLESRLGTEKKIRE